MKYYYKQPLSGYIILPLLGAILPFVFAVLVGEALVDGELSTGTKIGMLAFFYLFFLGWYAYANRYKDYVELTPGLIRIVRDERRKEPARTIPVADILLFEIITTCEPPADEWYVIHISGQTPASFQDFQVPCADVVRFCDENNIVPVRILRKYLDIDEIKIGLKEIKIKYESKPGWLNQWTSRKVKISYNDIDKIELVAPRPISTTENYYKVYTKAGASHEFPDYRVERVILDVYAKEYGFPIVEKKLYS